MMRYRYSTHARRRMSERKVLRTLVRKVIQAADHTYVDTLTGYTIYLKRLPFKGEERRIAVSVDQNKDSATIVSVHPIRERDFVSRTNSGRWI